MNRAERRMIKIIAACAIVASIAMLSFVIYNFGTANATSPSSGGANSTEARVIELQIFVEEWGYMTYDNGTRVSFLHSLPEPIYLATTTNSNSTVDPEVADAMARIEAAQAANKATLNDPNATMEEKCQVDPYYDPTCDNIIAPNSYPTFDELPPLRN